VNGTGDRLRATLTMFSAARREHVRLSYTVTAARFLPASGPDGAVRHNPDGPSRTTLNVPAAFMPLTKRPGVTQGQTTLYGEVWRLQRWSPTGPVHLQPRRERANTGQALIDIPEQARQGYCQQFASHGRAGPGLGSISPPGGGRAVSGTRGDRDTGGGEPRGCYGSDASRRGAHAIEKCTSRVPGWRAVGAESLPGPGGPRAQPRSQPVILTALGHRFSGALDSPQAPSSDSRSSSQVSRRRWQAQPRARKGTRDTPRQAAGRSG